jgi:hypothetical protein
MYFLLARSSRIGYLLPSEAWYEVRLKDHEAFDLIHTANMFKDYPAMLSVSISYKSLLIPEAEEGRPGRRLINLDATGSQSGVAKCHGCSPSNGHLMPQGVAAMTTTQCQPGDPFSARQVSHNADIHQFDVRIPRTSKPPLDLERLAVHYAVQIAVAHVHILRNSLKCLGSILGRRRVILVRGSQHVRLESTHKCNDKIASSDARCSLTRYRSIQSHR